jgi:delta 1-pyrroline-5-carboxylate dehydrogenase
MYIGSEEVRTGDIHDLFPPHDRHHKIGQYHRGNGSHVQQAIDAALAAKPMWESMPWEQRAAIFLKAAELMAALKKLWADTGATFPTPNPAYRPDNPTWWKRAATQPAQK